MRLVSGTLCPVESEKKTSSLELKVPPVIVFAVFAGIMWLLPRAVPGAGVAFPARGFIAAGMTVIAGILALAGISSFLKAKTTLNPHKPERSASLVTTGIYALTRNPMYLSLLLVLIGWAVYLSNLASFVLPPFFAAYIDRFQIRPEERMLVSLFGSEFKSYCKRVNRWL